MNKISSTLIILATTITVVIVESCASHEFPNYTCPDEAISYSAQVQSIVEAKCLVPSCHGDIPSLPNWGDYDQLHAHRAEVKRRVMERMMPPDDSPAGPLTEAEIATIACWVDNGAPNN